MKEMFQNQIMASLATLNQCIDNCPDAEWDKPHNDAPFSQVLFHTLFYIDFYLSMNEKEFKLQRFHKENFKLFRDYEELEKIKPIEQYSKNDIKDYLNFCRNKVDDYFFKIENDRLLDESSFKKMKIMELLIYVTRHIQHHAAQLGLRVQQVTGKKLNWVSSGFPAGNFAASGAASTI